MTQAPARTPGLRKGLLSSAAFVKGSLETGRTSQTRSRWSQFPAARRHRVRPEAAVSVSFPDRVTYLNHQSCQGIVHFENTNVFPHSDALGPFEQSVDFTFALGTLTHEQHQVGAPSTGPSRKTRLLGLPVSPMSTLTPPSHKNPQAATSGCPNPQPTSGLHCGTYVLSHLSLHDTPVWSSCQCVMCPSPLSPWP